MNSIYEPGWRDLFIVVFAYSGFLIINIGLPSIAIALSQDISLGAVLRANYLWVFPSASSTPLISLVLALLYLRVGVWPVVLFFAWNLIYTRSWATIAELKESSRRTLGMLASATDAGIPHLKGCSEAVAALGARIAREMGVSARRRERVEFAGLLHNVGLLGVDRKLLISPGPLDESGREKLRSHVERGASILEKVPALRSVAEVVRAQEERPDGAGHPRGLRGNQIPLEARVLRVAAAYEAMTAGRPAQPRLTPEAALATLEQGAGTAYDEQVVQVTVRLGRSGALPAAPANGSAA